MVALKAARILEKPPETRKLLAAPAECIAIHAEGSKFAELDA
jgi:hypothetical protein